MQEYFIIRPVLEKLCTLVETETVLDIEDIIDLNRWLDLKSEITKIMMPKPPKPPKNFKKKW